MRRVFTIIAFAIALLSCTEKLDNDDIVADTSVIADDATDLTPFSANIAVSFIPGTGVNHYWLGIVTSTEPNPTSSTVWGGEYYDEQSDKHIFEFRNLNPGTTYYYRAYAEYELVFQNKKVFDEFKSFSTPAMEPFIVTHPIETETSYVMRGSLTLDQKIVPENVTFLFSCGSRSTMTGKETDFGTTYAETQSDGSFTAEFNWDLEKETIGFYRAGVSYRGVYYWGEEVTFTK